MKNEELKMVEVDMNKSKNVLANLGSDWVLSNDGCLMIIKNFGYGECLVEYLADTMKASRCNKNFLDEYYNIAEQDDMLSLGFTTSRKSRLEVGSMIVEKLKKDF